MVRRNVILVSWKTATVKMIWRLIYCFVFTEHKMLSSLTIRQWLLVKRITLNMSLHVSFCLRCKFHSSTERTEKWASSSQSPCSVSRQRIWGVQRVLGYTPTSFPGKRPENEVVFNFLPCFWQTYFLLVFTHHSGKPVWKKFVSQCYVFLSYSLKELGKMCVIIIIFGDYKVIP